jgi:hypothetical protein
MKFIQIIFRNSLLTSNKTQDMSITKISWLMLLRKIIALSSENHTKLINTLCEQNARLLNVKGGGTYNYHFTLKD